TVQRRIFRGSSQRRAAELQRLQRPPGFAKSRSAAVELERLDLARVRVSPFEGAEKPREHRERRLSHGRAHDAPRGAIPLSPFAISAQAAAGVRGESESAGGVVSL